MRRRTAWATYRLASAEVPGPCAGLGDARAEHEVAVAVEHRPCDSLEIRTVERTVAVHERDDVALGGPEPGEACGTESAPGFRHDPRAAARATSAEPSVDPLSTTIAFHPAGIDASTAGMAGASSSTGRTTSGTGILGVGVRAVYGARVDPG